MLNFLTETTEKIISLLSGAFIVAAQITLVADVLRKKLKPSLLSWVGWALLMGTGLIAQVVEMGWEWSQTGLFFSAFGCLCIVFSALIRKHYLLVRSDFSYLFLVLAGHLVGVGGLDEGLIVDRGCGADLLAELSVGPVGEQAEVIDP